MAPCPGVPSHRTGLHFNANFGRCLRFLRPHTQHTAKHTTEHTAKHTAGVRGTGVSRAPGPRTCTPATSLPARAARGAERSVKPTAGNRVLHCETTVGRTLRRSVHRQPVVRARRSAHSARCRRHRGRRRRPGVGHRTCQRRYGVARGRRGNETHRRSAVPRGGLTAAPRRRPARCGVSCEGTQQGIARRGRWTARHTLHGFSARQSFAIRPPRRRLLRTRGTQVPARSAGGRRQPRLRRRAGTRT